MAMEFSSHVPPHLQVNADKLVYGTRGEIRSYIYSWSFALLHIYTLSLAIVSPAQGPLQFQARYLPAQST